MPQRQMRFYHKLKLDKNCITKCDQNCTKIARVNRPLDSLNAFGYRSKRRRGGWQFSISGTFQMADNSEYHTWQTLQTISSYSSSESNFSFQIPRFDTHCNFRVWNPVVRRHLVRNPAGQRSTRWSAQTADRFSDVTDVIQKAPCHVTTVQWRQVFLKWSKHK